MAPAAIRPSPSNGARHAQPPTPAKTPNKQPPGEKFDGAHYLNGEWFCRCGRRMYLRPVKKKGANHGRKYYSCDTEGNGNCGFFSFYEEVKHIEDKAAAKYGGIQTKLNFPTIDSPQNARPRQARVPSSSAPTRPISSRNNDDEPDELAGPAPGLAPSPAPSHSEPYRIPTPDLGDDVSQRQPPASTDPHRHDRVQSRRLAMRSSARQRRVCTIPEPEQTAAPTLPSDRRDGSPGAFEDAKESLDVDDGLSISSLSSTDQDELLAEADRLYEERNRHGGKVPSVQPTAARTPSPKRRRVEASFGLPTPRLTTPRHTLRIAREQREAKRAKISAHADTTSFATTKTTILGSTPSMDLDDDGSPSPTTPSRVQPKGPPRTFGTSSYPAPVPFPIQENALVGRHKSGTSQVQMQGKPQRSPPLFQSVLHQSVSGSDRIEDKLEEATFAVFSNADNMNPLPPEVVNKLKQVLGSFKRDMRSLRASRDNLRTVVQQQKLEIHNLGENLKKMREDRLARRVEVQRLAERMSDDLDHN